MSYFRFSEEFLVSLKNFKEKQDENKIEPDFGTISSQNSEDLKVESVLALGNADSKRYN